MIAGREQDPSGIEALSGTAVWVGVERSVGRNVTIPNFISIARLLGVPLLVWALIHGQWDLAFYTFLFAGLSDAVDGAIARAFDQRSALGVYLDPLADKALLIAVFVGLGLLGGLPDWIAVAVVSRDILILAAVLLSYVMGMPVTVRPLLVSKLTTLAQILLAGTALAVPAFALELSGELAILVGVTALLTGVSAVAYLIVWLRHMASDDWTSDREDPADEADGHQTSSGRADGAKGETR